MKRKLFEILLSFYRGSQPTVKDIRRKGYAIFVKVKLFYSKYRSAFNSKQTIISILREQNAEISNKHIERVLFYSKNKTFRDVWGLFEALSFSRPEVTKQITIYKLMYPALYAQHKRTLDQVLEELYLQKNCPEVFIFLCLTYQVYLQKQIENTLKPFSDDSLSPFVYAMQ